MFIGLIGLALRKENRLVRNQKQPMNIHLFLLLNFMFLNHQQCQYGMPMNYFSGQTVTPTYTDPIMSIPGSASIIQTNEIVQYTPPEISRNSVPHPGPISDEMFDRYVQRWQNWQRPVRPVQPVSL